MKNQMATPVPYYLVDRMQKARAARASMAPLKRARNRRILAASVIGVTAGFAISWPLGALLVLSGLILAHDERLIEGMNHV